MSEYEVAFIGTGANPENPSVEGFAMAYQHADGYQQLEDCNLVACADIVQENAEAFADEYGIDDDGVFTDYEEMLATTDPDVVSVTVPPAIHSDIVIGSLRAGDLDAIHCEKPMAYTLAQARLMAQEADRHGVQLTFNHQRRFARPVRRAKELIDEGAIGALRRIEVGWGDFYDNGSHMIDLCGYLNDEHAAEWVLAQLDYRREDVRFGAHQENQMLAQWEYENGVNGLLSTGDESSLSNAAITVRGTEGEIEIIPDDGPALRVRNGRGWDPVDVDGEGFHASEYNHRSVADVIRSLRTGEPSELRARNALNTAEIIFAGYESVRQRSRIDLPLVLDDNPLEAMVESGALTPQSADDGEE